MISILTDVYSFLTGIWSVILQHKRFKLFYVHFCSFFGAFNALCCVANTRKKVQVALPSFSKISAACIIKRHCCNTAEKSNRLEFAAVFHPAGYISTVTFRMISTWSIVSIFLATKRNMMISFQESLQLFKESLHLFKESLQSWRITKTSIKRLW